jgi:hypothetical protein
MGILADRFGPTPQPKPDPVEVVTNAALQAMAKLDAGMAAHVRTRGGPDDDPDIRRARDDHAVQMLKDAVLDARKLLYDATRSAR